MIHFAVSDGVTGDDGVSAPKQRSIDRWGTSTRSSHGWGVSLDRDALLPKLAARPILGVSAQKVVEHRSRREVT